MTPDEVRRRSLARADWLDELANKLRAEGDYAQADDLSAAATGIREAAWPEPT